MTGLSTKLLRYIGHIFDLTLMLTNNIDILGIPFCTSDDKNVTDRMRHSISTRSKLTIGYSHFFHTLLGRNDSALLDLYQKYDIILPDGYGVYIAGRFLYGKQKAFKKIFNGTDFYNLLLEEANLRRWSLFFLGDTEKVVQVLKEKVHDVWPDIRIAGAHHGFIDIVDEEIVSIINQSNADLLLIGMGTPKQDYWLWEHYYELNVPVSIVVGAGIGFISGKKIRAPISLRRIHMEWLFRLFQEPGRLWRRYLIGIPKFALYIILQKVRQI